MTKIDDKFKDLYKTLKEEIKNTTIIRPMTQFEFDIESIYIWHLIPHISFFCNYMDFHMSIDFLCFRFKVRLCPDIFKSPIEFDYFATPYITYSYNMYGYKHLINIGWLNWDYKICL